MTNRITPLAVAALLLVLAGCAKPTTPQVQGPLAIDIPEYCTVCIEVLRCESPSRQVAYLLHEQGAWAQIATIWNYFAEFFRPKTEDFRKLTIYDLAPDASRAVASRASLEARLDVWNRRVELPDAIVDQKTGAWLTSDGVNQGQCTHLPRGPDRQFIATLQETTS
ncbi:MAG: hypothetical protein IPG25_09090 [Proteobacteria bacterium]|nr:hypothetical protein [Pseudomonadota bacterium]